ncbi:MAG: DUF3939 domain-containing protein [Bacillota bacterium]|nr:DUF3939 domain-containing protein [Bacillota bacterium]
MKQKFIKHFNRMTESIEISIEESWIHIHYTKDTIEKTVYALKNNEITIEAYFEDFFEENRVSDEMRKDVREYLRNQKQPVNLHWQEFKHFLSKAISLHLVFGVTIALVVFGGYELGLSLDNYYHQYPAFTVIGFFSGIVIGGFITFIIGQKYSHHTNRKQMFGGQPSILISKNDENLPIIDVTLDDVRKAVGIFSASLPQGVYRTILVKDDNSIDFNQLSYILGGVPFRNFYMSKETYEIFEEHDKLIPREMDLVQKAVDLYVMEKKEYPILKDDPFRKVNYYQLISGHYLKDTPKVEFYISQFDGMICSMEQGKK